MNLNKLNPFNLFHKLENGDTYIRPFGIIVSIAIITSDLFIVRFLNSLLTDKFIEYALENTFINSSFMFNILIFSIELLIGILSLCIIRFFCSKNCPDINYKSNIKLNDLIFLFILILGFRLFYEGSISQVQNIIEKPFDTLASIKLDFRLNDFLHAIIYAPIIEEVLYRGFLFNGLLKKYPLWFAILISSLLFSVMHFSLFQSINAFLLALMLSYIFYKTKSLLLCIYFHLLNNVLATSMLSFMFDSIFLNFIYVIANLFIGAFGIYIAVNGLKLRNRQKLIKTENTNTNFFIE